MHKSPYEDENYYRMQKKAQNTGKGKDVYGYFEKYQHNYRTNEIPEIEIFSRKQKTYTKVGHHKKHRYHHSSKIKKLRTKPEAGIMQKKIKI